MMTTTLSRIQLGPTRKLSRVSSQVSATLLGSKERGYLGWEAQQLNTMRVVKHELIMYDRAHVNNNTDTCCQPANAYLYKKTLRAMTVQTTIYIHMMSQLSQCSL
jgi:hypothetical protein